MDYSTNFRKFRLRAGYTQESFAHALGLDPSVVNRIESGKRKLTMDIIPAIAKATQTSPEEVMKKLHDPFVTVNSTIQENKGTGVQVNSQGMDVIRELYERIIAEKEHRISQLEDQLRARENSLV